LESPDPENVTMAKSDKENRRIETDEKIVNDNRKRNDSSAVQRVRRPAFNHSYQIYNENKI